MDPASKIVWISGAERARLRICRRTGVSLRTRSCRGVTGGALDLRSGPSDLAIPALQLAFVVAEESPDLVGHTEDLSHSSYHRKRRTPRATRRPSRSSPQVGSFWDIPGGPGGRGACLPRPRHRRLPPRPRVLYPGSETGTNSAHRFNHGETDMGDKGSKDKGKREQQKKAQLSPKEKRKLKREKKKK